MGRADWLIDPQGGKRSEKAKSAWQEDPLPVRRFSLSGRTGLAPQNRTVSGVGRRPATESGKQSSPHVICSGLPERGSRTAGSVGG